MKKLPFRKPKDPEILQESHLWRCSFYRNSKQFQWGK